MTRVLDLVDREKVTLFVFFVRQFVVMLFKWP
jgi:hypothetical protein